MRINGQNFIKPDVVVSWPKHLDYPLFRQMIRDNRDYFEKVIVVLTDMNVGKDYTGFLRSALKPDRVIVLDSPKPTGEEDWRNVAMTEALSNTKNPWIWFTEQDFSFKPGFWELVQEQMLVVPYIRVLVGERVHPCCIFVKRKLLNETSLDFSVIKDVSDHFSKIQLELIGKPFFDIPQELWTHLGGLSQNMYKIQTGEEAMYFPEEFKNYLKECLSVKVPMHDDFIRLFKEKM